MGCPIRKSTDQSLFAAPHGLSQRITSFIACACQGIHQMPLRHLIVLIANAHPDPAPKRKTERGRTFAHSSDTANMRLRATAPHVLQRYPANMIAPTKSNHAGKKTSFQRRNPMMAVRHINPGVSNTRFADIQPPAGTPVSTRRAMNPAARCSRRNRIRKTPHMAPASHDPSGPVFSSLCHQNRQTAHQHSLQTLSSSWMANPAAPTMGTHKQGTSHSRMVEPVGIEPTTLCLQSRCSPS